MEVVRPTPLAGALFIGALYTLRVTDTPGQPAALRETWEENVIGYAGEVVQCSKQIWVQLPPLTPAPLGEIACSVCPRLWCWEIGTTIPSCVNGL